MKTPKTNPEIESLKKDLRKMLKPGTKIHSIVRHVARSGMSRNIDFYVNQGGEMRYLTGYMEKLGIGNRSKEGGLRVQGCGMDMCFHCVYTPGRILYPQGFKLAKGQMGRNGDTSGFDNDGGYALKSEQL